MIAVLGVNMMVPTVIAYADTTKTKNDTAVTNSFSITDEQFKESSILADNIFLDQNGKYYLNTKNIKGVSKENVKKIEGILSYLNNPTQVEEFSIEQVPNSFVSTRGFGNWYWWGYAYTFTRTDMAKISKLASSIGAVAALAYFIPDVTYSKAIGAAGSILSAAGGLINLMNARYFTLNFLKVGTITFSIAW